MFDNVTIDLSYLSCADEPEPSSTSSPTVNLTSTPTVQSTGRLSCTAEVCYNEWLINLLITLLVVGMNSYITLCRIHRIL